MRMPKAKEKGTDTRRRRKDEKNNSALTDRMNEVEKAIEAVAKEISKDFKENEKDVYELAANRVLDQYGDNRILCNRAKRLLSLLDGVAEPAETRIAFVAMSMGVPGMGEPTKNFRRTLEQGEAKAGAKLRWASLAEALDMFSEGKFGKVTKALGNPALTVVLTGAFSKVASLWGAKSMTPMLGTAIVFCAATVSKGISHFIHVMANEKDKGKELAIDELMNAAKSEVMVQLEKCLPKDWMKLYNYGLVDMDEFAHPIVTDERCVRDVAEAVRCDLEELHGRSIDTAMYDKESLEADLYGVFRMKQGKEAEKSGKARENEKMAGKSLAMRKEERKER